LASALTRGLPGDFPVWIARRDSLADLFSKCSEQMAAIDWNIPEEKLLEPAMMRKITDWVTRTLDGFCS
jgi:hypothetical protein